MAAGAWAVALDQIDPPEQRADLASAPWHQWLRTVAGRFFRAAFAAHHEAFWAWVWAITQGVRPKPFVAIWNRGGAKSTSAEVAVAAVAARRTRRYVLYVCDTQDRANGHVQNIAAVLEGSAMERHHPELARRLVGKYGPKEWSRTRLRTSTGFTVDALGLDTASRGVKVEDQRPDMIVIDDVDKDSDSPAVAAAKIETLTRAVIPAGSTDVAILAVQTITNPHGFFARMVPGHSNPADYLRRRIMSGPIPAIDGLEVEERDDAWTITHGKATWAGLSISRCQAILDDIGITSFLAEYQHEVEPPAGGMWDKVTFARIDWSEIPWGLILRSTVWVDPAVSSTDSSDSYGIQADAVGIDGTIYRLWSWEQRTSPLDALKRAIRTAWLLGAESVGVETDQGGDTWAVVYQRAGELMAEEWLATRGVKAPALPIFHHQKAGQGGMSKVQRASKMLVDYETPGRKIVHVRGTHLTLERALRRFPKTKPHDLVDASYWSWDHLRHGSLIPPQPPPPTGETLTGDLMTKQW